MSCVCSVRVYAGRWLGAAWLGAAWLGAAWLGAAWLRTIGQVERGGDVEGEEARMGARALGVVDVDEGGPPGDRALPR
eukprot:6984056-Prymnesium_polylepis.1